jgi:AI-2 transport protein TqsA
MAETSGIETGTAAAGRSVRFRRELLPLYALAAAIICAAGGWYLLKELAPLLRPLVLAIFLVYTVMPVHQVFRSRVSSMAATLLMALLAGALVIGLALMVYGNLLDLKAELPQLIERGSRLLEQGRDWERGHLPAWLMEPAPDAARAKAEWAERLKAGAAALVNAAAGFIAEAVVVGFYLIFLLIDVSRLPGRVRAGFSSEQADRLLGVVGSINRAMASYLRAKALSSLITAVPVVVVLWAFGVPFAGMWGVLTFVGNFIPYVGSLVAFLPPVALAFLELEPAWKPLAVLSLLAVSQFAINNFIEPTLTARAVDLSPLVVLVALAFWGLCWGLTGMVLAVPLTVMLKIIWENVSITRPLARLMAED